MIDDKDESAPDPWAGIDDDGDGQSADGFSFSFDAASEINDQASPPTSEESSLAEFPVSAEDNPLAVPLETSAHAGADEDPFASLSIDADDAAAANDDDMFQPIPSDDLHHQSDAAIESAGGSSHVEVGTGFSGIVSPSEVDPPSSVAPAEEWPADIAGDAATDAGETLLDDFATDDQPSFDASGFDGVSDLDEAAPAPEEQVQDHALEVAGAAAAVATAAVAKPRPPTRKQGGGIGQIIAIVLGGVMAIPITYAILIWGFQRDPFKLAGMAPEQVAFLLPQKLQPGAKKSGGLKPAAPSPLDQLAAVADVPEPAAEPAAESAPGEAAASPAADAAAPALEGEAPLAAEGTKMPKETPAEPSPEEPAAAPRAPADEFALAPPQPVEPPAPPEPEPLDLSALEAAVGAASAAFDELTAADPESPDRKKLLVTWYKRLAAAAEQLVLLEKVAVDSGRPLGDAAAVIDPLSTAIVADGAVQEDLSRLSGMWLGSKKRPTDGAMLLATFDGARQVGPYWSMLITVEGGEPRSVNVISRIEPRVEPGERVLVTGVVFDGDVVWATDCRPLVKKAAPVEDLF